MAAFAVSFGKKVLWVSLDKESRLCLLLGCEDDRAGSVTTEVKAFLRVGVEGLAGVSVYVLDGWMDGCAVFGGRPTASVFQSGDLDEPGTLCRARREVAQYLKRDNSSQGLLAAVALRRLGRLTPFSELEFETEARNHRLDTSEYAHRSYKMTKTLCGRKLEIELSAGGEIVRSGEHMSRSCCLDFKAENSSRSSLAADFRQTNRRQTLTDDIAASPTIRKPQIDELLN